MEVCYRFPIRRRDGSVRAYGTVDLADASAVRGSTWRLVAKNYVGRDVGGRKILLHRLLTDAEPTREVDHVDGNGLNNRRANLRLATHAENQQNRTTARGTSRHRGVSWDASRGKWRASHGLAGSVHLIGRFTSEIEAARAAAAWRAENMPFAIG